MTDIKERLLNEAGKAVTGPRRAAYGTPKENFDRIVRFWNAYLENTGRELVDRETGLRRPLKAEDVSPLMRLMKEARLCETPDHYDGHVDLIGYTLTGAEVNNVGATAGPVTVPPCDAPKRVGPPTVRKQDQRDWDKEEQEYELFQALKTRDNPIGHPMQNEK